MIQFTIVCVIVFGGKNTTIKNTKTNSRCCFVCLLNVIWPQTVECRRKVYENRALKRMFDLNRRRVRGGWLKLHNAELRKLCCSSDVTGVFKRMRYPGKEASAGKKRNAHRTVVRKSDEMGPLRIPRRRWKDDIKTDLKGTGRLEVEWIDLDRNTIRSHAR
jgi:hypothetical protein